MIQTFHSEKTRTWLIEALYGPLQEVWSHFHEGAVAQLATLVADYALLTRAERLQRFDDATPFTSEWKSFSDTPFTPHIEFTKRSELCWRLPWWDLVPLSRSSVELLLLCTQDEDVREVVDARLSELSPDQCWPRCWPGRLRNQWLERWCHDKLFNVAQQRLFRKMTVDQRRRGKTGKVLDKRNKKKQYLRAIRGGGQCISR